MYWTAIKCSAHNQCSGLRRRDLHASHHTRLWIDAWDKSRFVRGAARPYARAQLDTYNRLTLTTENQRGDS
jgi:hypothetical protein